MKRFGIYMAHVRSQLTCNANDDYKSEFITYTYDNETVDANLPYFLDCMRSGLSAYKALLFFNEYLKDKKL
jgi:hypothetical protein